MWIRACGAPSWPRRALRPDTLVQIDQPPSDRLRTGEPYVFELDVLQIKFLSQPSSQLFGFLVEGRHFVEERIPGRRGLNGLS